MEVVVEPVVPAAQGTGASEAEEEDDDVDRIVDPECGK
jgi:hypothetical protein